MKISELSRLSGVSTRSIRHYDSKGLLQSNRLENDYREFDESAVQLVKTIQLYLKLGLTTDQIESLFKGEIAAPDDYEFCEEMLQMYEGKLQDVNENIKALEELKQLLERQIRIAKDNKVNV